MLKVLKKSKKCSKNSESAEKVHQKSACDCFLSECEDKKRRKRLSCFILGIALFLIIGPGYFFFIQRFSTASRFSEQKIIEADQELMTLASLIYRHFNGYEAYCAKNGYKMQQYPKAFVAAFQSEMTLLDQQAREQGLSLESLLNKINVQFGPAFDRIIATELKELQQVVLANQKTPESLENTTVSVQDICRLIDENAALILSEPANEDFIRIRQVVSHLKQES